MLTLLMMTSLIPPVLCSQEMGRYEEVKARRHSAPVPGAARGHQEAGGRKWSGESHHQENKTNILGSVLMKLALRLQRRELKES